MKKDFTLLTSPHLLFAAIFLFATFTTNAQTNLGLNWVKGLNNGQAGSGNVFSSSIAVDGSGNVYVTGYFSGTIDFDPGAGVANLVSAGVYDIFIAKYDAAGNYVYAKSMGGTGYYSYSSSLAVDGSGNVYVTGYFQGTVDFDPGAGVANLVSAGDYDIFIAKYDAAGNYVYAKSMGGTGYDRANGLVVDGSGNVYITGFFEYTADFDPGTGVANLVSAGGLDVFIAKYDATGNYVYAKSMGGTGNNYGSSLAVDGSGNVYVTGFFADTVDFDPGTGVTNLVSAGDDDIFIAKYDATGNYVYAKSMGGTGYDRGNCLAVDGSGNVYVTGYFQDTADFDPGAGVANLVNNAGSEDIFIAKYDAAGNYIYAKSMGGIGTDQSSYLALDGSGNTYITGLFQDTVDFDPGAGVANLVSAGGLDVFIAKYDATGNYVYAKSMGGIGYEAASSLAVDGSSNVYIMGNYYDTADFDPGAGVYNLTSLNFRDIFIGKYSECSSAVLTTVSTPGLAYVSGETDITDGGCRLLADITPNGANPVSDTVNVQVWIESSVPTYAGQPFVARHYQITPATNPNTATASVTLYFTQQEFTDFNAAAGSVDNLPTGPGDATGKANLRIGKYSGVSSDGSGLPDSYSSGVTVIDPDDANIVWNSSLSRWEVSFDVTGFSGFIVQTSTSALPLTLLEFNGHLQSNNAILNWKTENEINTDRFIVERSTDGISFTAVGSVDALNRSGTSNYNFTDPNIVSLASPVVYYRLLQKDIDGRITYSMIIALSVDNKNILLLYPNPAINDVNLTITATRPDKIQARIIDNAGRIVHQQQLNVVAGSMVIAIDVSKLAKGMYYLELKGESMNERKQFLKQ
ncbi:MAG: SBBP repeat-containing protein [Bacteroidota bacterium]|nr:SBBP repeat-containing protein [Bacteroidota bacterium]